MSMYDIEFTNPMGWPGTLHSLEANSEEDAIKNAPIMLSASSQYTPDQFKIVSVKLSEQQVSLNQETSIE